VKTLRKTARGPKRLYVRLVRFGPDAEVTGKERRALREFTENIDRVGRLVGHGPLSGPEGDFLIFRAADRAEADRVLRPDPLRQFPGARYEVLEWSPHSAGTGVSLEPPPARGSGRLTLLQRIPVVVSDQRRSIDWYRDVLGLTVLAHDDDTQYVELGLGPGTTAISLIVPRPDWGEPHYSETKARLGILTGIVFRTDSVPALALRLKHAGARILRGVEHQPWGERTLLFSDPDGNQMLAFDRPFEDGIRTENAAATVARRAKSAPP
jgi:catechol 2,3-dioxygenase-like lactoylglutathione lyase family enzyme